jgi:hypothetical protein
LYEHIAKNGIPGALCPAVGMSLPLTIGSVALEGLLVAGCLPDAQLGPLWL